MMKKFETRNSTANFPVFMAEGTEYGDLPPATTVAKIATVANRGIRGEVVGELECYSLDAIFRAFRKVHLAVPNCAIWKSRFPNSQLTHIYYRKIHEQSPNLTIRQPLLAESEDVHSDRFTCLSKSKMEPIQCIGKSGRLQHGEGDCNK